jgi:hypothetical protein
MMGWMAPLRHLERIPVILHIRRERRSWHKL